MSSLLVVVSASCLLHLGRAAPGQRENTEIVAKVPQPAQPRNHARGARPEDHVITNSAHARKKICIHTNFHVCWSFGY